MSIARSSVCGRGLLHFFGPTRLCIEMNKLTECCRTSTTERNELNVSKPVLHYFDIFGRASPARMAFTVAKESFEDRRIQLSDWPQHKNTFLTGQVPALQIGDETYYESIPISYYAARNTTLIPSNSLERLQIDSVVNFVSNAWKLNSKIYHTKPEDKERVSSSLPSIWFILRSLYSLRRSLLS